MTEAWDALVEEARDRAADLKLYVLADIAAILQGQAEIERLDAALAEAERAIEWHGNLHAELANKLAEAKRELDEARALLASEWEQDQDRAQAAIPPAAPAVIETVAIIDDEDYQTEVHLFERHADATAFGAIHRSASLLHRDWVKLIAHPAAPGESGEAADG